MEEAARGLGDIINTILLSARVRGCLRRSAAGQRRPGPAGSGVVTYSHVLFVWVLQKQLRCGSSSAMEIIYIEKPATLRHKGDDSLWRSVGGFLISINSLALELRQRCRHEKSPY